MIELENVDLGASKLDPDTGVELLDGKGAQLGPDPGDAPSFTDMPVYSCLGVTALPAPADDSGNAEALICSGGVAGIGPNGAVIGARDVRDNTVVGNMSAGSSVLHATGPDSRAQCQCSADGSVSLVTKNRQGHNLGVFVVGDADQVLISAGGAVFEMHPDTGIRMTDKDGKAGVLIKNGRLTLFGTEVIIGGKTPVGTVMHGTPATGFATPAPTPGVYVGT